MNLRDGFGNIYGEIIDKVKYLIDNTQFIGGDEVALFEKEFARFCHAEYAVGCSNGTDALILALKALNIGKTDTVLVPVNTFIATAEAVTAVGANVEFIDVDEKTFNINTELLKDHLEKNLSKNVKAVIPVHLYGQMADMVQICKIAESYGLKVIEDSSQAHGATCNGKNPGQYGDVATFSFYPGKNLGAFGDAGALVTNNESLYEKCKMLVNHGRWKEKYKHAIEGFNKRLDTLQAAILRIKLKLLSESTGKRRAIARMYKAKLKEIDSIVLPEVTRGAEHVWHLFVVRIEMRDNIQTRLKESGISTGIHYPIPLHLQPAYAYKNYKQGDFPVAERLSREILSLPFWPEITEEQIEYVCNTIKSII